MVKNVNAKQLEQELSNYLRSGKNTPLFVASYTGMGKTAIVEKAINSNQLILGKDFTRRNEYNSKGYDDWKLVYYQLNNIPYDYSHIANIVQTGGKHQTIVEVSLRSADYELEVNPIYGQYEKEEWLLYRPTFEEWLQWAEQKSDNKNSNVNPIFLDFIKWTGEKVLYPQNGTHDRYSPRGWADISKKFDDILKGILNKNDDLDWDYYGCLDKSKDEYKVNYIHPNVLSEAIRHIPEECWPDIISHYCPNFRIRGKEINEDEKVEVINNIMIGRVEVGTHSEHSLPSKMFKEYLQRPKES